MKSIHQNYLDLTEEQKDAVDAAFSDAALALTTAGYTTAMDDRAERLVEALATYLIESIEI